MTRIKIRCRRKRQFVQLPSLPILLIHSSTQCQVHRLCVRLANWPKAPPTLTLTSDPLKPPHPCSRSLCGGQWSLWTKTRWFQAVKMACCNNPQRILLSHSHNESFRTDEIHAIYRLICMCEIKMIKYINHTIWNLFEQLN